MWSGRCMLRKEQVGKIISEPREVGRSREQTRAAASRDTVDMTDNCGETWFHQGESRTLSQSKHAFNQC